MPKPLESSLKTSTERKLKALRAQDNGLVFRKRHGSVYGLAGDPDFYGLWHGLHWELELKAPGEKPTQLQLERQAEWARAGALVAYADAPNMVDAFLSTLAELASHSRAKYAYYPIRTFAREPRNL
jgi:hypothetical protein